MELNKIHILSTRPLDEELIHGAGARNISIDVVPFIKQEPIASPELDKEIEAALTETTTIVFTGAEAVDALASKINSQETKWKIFCIGYATKQFVVKKFGERLIAGVGDNAKELAKVIIDANVRRVIFFCSDQRRDELPDLLKKNKVEVKEIVVYRTIATSQKINKKYDGILFFSPSAVKSFFRENGIDRKVILFAIGDTTAGEIKKFCGNEIVISDVPDKKNLLDKVTFYFQANPTHH